MAPLLETIWKRYENVYVWTWPKVNASLRESLSSSAFVHGSGLKGANGMSKLFTSAFLTFTINDMSFSSCLQRLLAWECSFSKLLVCQLISAQLSLTNCALDSSCFCRITIWRLMPSNSAAITLHGQLHGTFWPEAQFTSSVRLFSCMVSESICFDMGKLTFEFRSIAWDPSSVQDWTAVTFEIAVDLSRVFDWCSIECACVSSSCWFALALNSAFSINWINLSLRRWPFLPRDNNVCLFLSCETRVK